ncbi:MAG: phosphodiester glycosidase family protein [Sphingobacteriia bacterium]|nr:MAG: phosphodiester glycosidase family protein [Sphingobacteriia bacterium]
MRWFSIIFLFLFVTVSGNAQLRWQNVDADFQPLPEGVHIYYSNDSLAGKPNIAYYLSAELKHTNYNFSAQIGSGKRYTPSQYYLQEKLPLLVVNTSFFDFRENRNLNVIIKQGKMLAYNQQCIVGKGRDSLTYIHLFGSAIGINKNREADIAWLYTDSNSRFPLASQNAIPIVKDSIARYTKKHLSKSSQFKKWKMQTAVGGGPVLVQHGKVQLSNNEELKFVGKAIYDLHPRTAMGYTANNKLIVLVVEGRNPKRAEGADLLQLGKILLDIGCVEAINLDGGGSSCMLINGKETIKPSDKEGQRPIPAVFMIQTISSPKQVQKLLK